MNKKKKRKTKIEYSKKIETIFLCAYIVGILIGIYAVIVDTTALEALLVYIGGSSTIATSFYFWKARCENIIKIRKDHPDFDFSEVDMDDECD